MKGLSRRDSSVISMLATLPEDLSLIFNTHVESQVWIVTQDWKGRDMCVPGLGASQWCETTGTCCIQVLAHWGSNKQILKMNQVQERWQSVSEHERNCSLFTVPIAKTL